MTILGYIFRVTSIEKMPLEYFFSEKDGLLVVSLKGVLDDEQQAVVEKCVAEAKEKHPLGIVVNLSEATGLGREAYRPFALLLRGLKTICRAVKVTGLDANVQTLFVEQGLVSLSELRPSLAEALKELAQQIRIGSE